MDGRTYALIRAYDEDSAFAAFHSSVWSDFLHELKEDGKFVWPFDSPYLLEIRLATPEEEAIWEKDFKSELDLGPEHYGFFMCAVFGKEED